MISLRHPQRSPLVRLLAHGLICLLVLAGTPLEVWAYARFDPPLSATKTPMGNRETATDSRGTTNYTYDNRNRLEMLTYPDGRKLTYGYDANGNRTSLTAEVGGQTLTTSYSYDELNRLQTVTDSEGRDYVHEYDPNGNRAKLAYPNNTETSYVYDDLNRLTNLTTVNTATLGMIQSYQYTLGAAGNRERIDEHDGTARVYTYDDLYRLQKETISGSVGLVYEKSFVYDPVGNRESQTTVGTGAPGTPLAPGTIDYSYDDRDRILTEGTQPYSWDENGNLVTKDVEASYFWDFENRLTRVEKTDGTVVTHAYDADGRRVQTEITPSIGPPEVTEFLVDSSGPLSHVVVESSEVGAPITQYVRGDELLAALRPTETRYFHSDGLGSIRRMTDEKGAITDGYTYTGFGELIAHTGEDPQPYAFTGEPLDLNVGWQYNRARWVDPRVGRFPSLDLYAGDLLAPLTLHKYVYVVNSPLNLADPAGLMPAPIQLQIGRVAHTLISLYYDALNGLIDRGVRNGNRGRTDIRFHDDATGFAGTKGEVYEIKSRREYQRGFRELGDYIVGLRTSFPDIDWRRGESIVPVPNIWPGEMVHPTKSGETMHAQLEFGGVIVYWFEPEQRISDLEMHLISVAVVLQSLANIRAAQISTGVALSASFPGGL